MPNRMIKETIRSSKQIGSLDDFSFRTWLYLLTYVDDFGRGSADPELLKGFLFARRKGTTEKNIDDALSKLASVGLVRIYEVDGEPFLWFPTWSKHQRIQTKQSKFPAPPEEEDTESHGESRWVTVDHGDPLLETKPSRNQVEVETKKNNKHEKTFVPPALDEIIAYCDEKNLTVDPQQFFDFFDAGDWKDSKGNKVKNWKQKILTWEKYQSDKPKKPEAKPKPVSFMDLTWEDEVIYES